MHCSVSCAFVVGWWAIDVDEWNEDAERVGVNKRGFTAKQREDKRDVSGSTRRNV